MAFEQSTKFPQPKQATPDNQSYLLVLKREIEQRLESDGKNVPEIVNEVFLSIVIDILKEKGTPAPEMVARLLYKN